jgi:hypothetical protein
MQEKAIVYYVLAVLACWAIDLVMAVARGPVMIDPIVKLIVVVACLVVVVLGLARRGWLIGP